MHGDGNQIYGLQVVIHNGLFAECGVIGNFQGLVDWSWRTTTLPVLRKVGSNSGKMSRSRINNFSECVPLNLWGPVHRNSVDTHTEAN